MRAKQLLVSFSLLESWLRGMDKGVVPYSTDLPDDVRVWRVYQESFDLSQFRLVLISDTWPEVEDGVTPEIIDVKVTPRERERENG